MDLPRPAVGDPPRPPCILVVDDEALVRKVASSLLRRAGHTVHVAGNGGDALDVLDGTPVDLLLTDVRMPQMSGPELVRRAREDRPGLPVLYMSGFLGRETDPGRLGDPLLQKPFCGRDLRRAVADLLGEGAGSPRAKRHLLARFTREDHHVRRITSCVSSWRGPA